MAVVVVPVTLHDSGLVIMETTLNNYNATLWDLVVPTGVLMSWTRAAVSNRISPDGATWVDIFARYNSGTYNNAWIVVNYNNFTPFFPLSPGTLYMIEQLPGFTQAADMTGMRPAC